MSKTNIGNLEHQIERLVREHIKACHRAVTVAVERAFRGESSAALKGQGRARAKPATRQREEIAALGERLYQAICANPGAGIVALAAEVGVNPRELNWPATQLRRAGRVRSIGERRATRYFPMVAKAAGRS